MPFTPPQPLSLDHRIIYLNASALKTLACEDRFSLTCVSGWKPRAENPVFAVGKAVHKFAELIDKGEDEMAALTVACQTPGIPDKATIVNATTGLRQANLNKPATIDGQPLIEHKFCVKFDELMVDGITYEVYLTGRFDRIADTRLGIEITDYKSTRKWDFDDVVKAYADDVQFLFYYTVARLKAYEVFDDPRIAELCWQGKLFTRLCAVMIKKSQSATWRLGPLWSPPEELFREFVEGLRSKIVPHVVLLYARKIVLTKDGLYKNLCPGCSLADLCLRELPDGYVREPYAPLSW